MLGYCLVLASSFFFCIQNVVVRILFTEQVMVGIGPVGGYVTPTWENSFLLLCLRMVLAVPLMGFFSNVLYPKLWTDLKTLCHPRTCGHHRPAILHSLVGGGLMFAYLALLYLALGLVATGVAMTLFFTFPVFTALISWGYFGQRPSAYRWGIMALVMVGSVLTVPPGDFTGQGGNGWGIVAGIGSGVAYALYTVNAQKAFESIHPVPFTWLSFAVTLVLSGGLVLIYPPGDFWALDWGPIWIGSLVSGIVTFGGHVLYNSGIRLVGATVAAMVGSANPALTVLLAWVSIRETLALVQGIGVTLVTISVAALSAEPHRSVEP